MQRHVQPLGSALGSTLKKDLVYDGIRVVTPDGTRESPTQFYKLIGASEAAVPPAETFEARGFEGCSHDDSTQCTFEGERWARPSLRCKLQRWRFRYQAWR